MAPFASWSKPEEDINLLAPGQKAVLPNSDVEGVLLCVSFSSFFFCYSQNIQKLVSGGGRCGEREEVKRLPTACLPASLAACRSAGMVRKVSLLARDRSVSGDKMLHIYVRN